MLKSCLCTEHRLRSPEFKAWAGLMGEAPGHMHRKIWEFCFICEALQERLMLKPDRLGLGFAVGEEPLSSLFASRNVDILATDLSAEEAKRIGWVETNEHASELSILNKRNLCDAATFGARVRFQTCDMNYIPGEFNERFDFVWSACALEHLGSIKLGQTFIYNSVDCLKPGGIAVHTTEYNISSRTNTVDNEGTVIFRRCDIEEVLETLTNSGHEIEMDWHEGDGLLDQFVDIPPYSHNPHLKLQLGRYVTTSIGLIIRRRA